MSTGRCCCCCDGGGGAGGGGRAACIACCVVVVGGERKERVCFFVFCTRVRLATKREMTTTAAAIVAVALLAAEAVRSRTRLARVRAVMARIDAANARDPRNPPLELEYGLRMSATLARFCPDAPLLARIACRGQHVCRWEIPRASYAEGTAGYLAWRKALQAVHATRVAEFMRAERFAESECAAAAAMVAKKDFRHDEAAQLVEDVAALTFLMHYFPAFTEKQDNKSKLVTIVAKTWKKMSPRARDYALTLKLEPAQADVVRLALQEADQAAAAADD